MSDSASRPPVYVWPSLTYTDADAAIKFLVDGLGFELASRHEDDGLVVHCELRWPAGGGVMLGSYRPEGALKSLPPNTGAVYLAALDAATVDRLFASAVEAGGNVVMEISDKDYGSHEFGVTDPAGVYWYVGTFAGE